MGMAKVIIECFTFWCPATLGSFSLWRNFTGVPLNTGIKCRLCMKNHDFQPISCFVLETIQDKAIITAQHYLEIVLRSIK